MRYEKTEQELFEGRIRKQERENANLKRLFEATFYEDCTFLLRGMRGLMDEQNSEKTVKIPAFV